MAVVKLSVLPAHIGELDVAVFAGMALTTTVRSKGGAGHPALVAMQVYLPDTEAVTLAMTGFCKVLVKPLGPVH